MEAETCTATHAVIPTSDVLIPRTIMLSSLLQHLFQARIKQCTALSKLPSLSISIRPAFVG